LPGLDNANRQKFKPDTRRGKSQHRLEIARR
jgi:hypothetical protein